MKFEVRRTSGSYSDEVAPCPEAIKEPCVRVDLRTFKSFAEHDAQLPGDAPFTKRGSNHRVVYGPRGGVQGIARDFAAEHWVVEIADLAALMAFHERYGELVIGKSWRNDETPAIEIYDDYRE